MRRCVASCCMVVAVCAAGGQAVGGEGVLQAVGPAKALVPLRVGQLGPDGTVVEWRSYGTRQDCDWVLIWDAFDPDPLDGSPCCGEGCDMAGPGYRWYFDETYCNVYASNDMQFEAGPDFAERLEWAWFWYVRGQNTGENCAIYVETYEDFDDTCELGDAGLGGWLGGVVLDFGYLDSGSGTGYYYTDVDLCGMGFLPFPIDGAGAYNISLATYDDSDPDTLRPATCAQPMLWGTNNPASDGPGTQGPIQWNDDYPPDWHHQVPEECNDYAFGLCPDPLAAMACFYDAADSGEGCVGDLDGDGMTGHSDLGILLSDWGCSGGSCVGDIDGDGSTGHSDLGVLLSDWNCAEGEGDECEVVTFNVPQNRGGCRKTDPGIHVSEYFEMSATFRNVCACCEYRQYVKGFFKVNGAELVHRLCNENMGKKKFKEDGYEDGDDCHFYGHRDDAWGQGGNDTYSNPNRATGCTYLGKDAPGLRNLADGDTYEIDLTFNGKIIDVCNANKVKKTTNWTVKCAGTAMTERTPTKEVVRETRIDETPITVSLTAYEEPILTVVVSIGNGAGEIPIDAGEVDLRIAGMMPTEVPQGTLVETRLRGATAHAVYEFDYPLDQRGQTLRVELSYQGSEPVSFEVEM